MDRSKLLQQFVLEANEHIERAERALMALEKEPGNADHIHAVFQAVHGIKGSSDYVELTGISRLSHEMESLLGKLRKGALSASSGIVDRLLKGVDLLRDCVAHHDNPEHRADDIKACIDALDALKSEDDPARKPGATESTKGDRTSSAGPAKPDLLAVFSDTARQHLEALRIVHSDLEHGEIDAKGARILRRTIKTFRNSAAYLGLEDVTGLLDDMRESYGGELTAAQASSLEQDLHRLEELLDELTVQSQPEASAEGEPSEDPAPAPEDDAVTTGAPTGDTDDTLRISMRKLDQFMNQVSDLVLLRNALAHLAATSGLEQMGGDFARRLQNTSNQLTKTAERLQEQVMSMRLLPIGHLFDRFPRLVRDLGRNHGKEVRLMTLGQDTEVDKSVADLLTDPLMHLVRNAVAHGLEDAEERQAAGKPAVGSITLKAEHEGGYISVEVIDDGRGLDPARIAATAVGNNLLSKDEAAALTEPELVDLIFRPGFSTARTADRLAGRGVGLDVVRTNVKRMGGSLEVDWEPGQGARFRIKIPLTLAVIRTLVVEAGDERYALPINFVEESLRVSADRITRLNNVRTIIYKQQPVPLLGLAEVLGGAAPADADSYTTVLVRYGGRRFGLIIDGILMQQDALIRPLDSELAKLGRFSGATVMSDGRLILILHPPGLLSGQRIGAAA